MLPPVFAELKATTSEFHAKMGEAKAEIEHLSKEGSGHFDKLAAVGKAAILGIAGAGLGIGVIAVKAALQGEQAHAALAQAVKNAGGSMEELEPKVSSLADHFAKLGYTNDELDQGLAAMTTSLRDPEKAMGAMGLAADLARFKHIDLTAASLAVAKAMEGQLRPLKALGIDLPVSAAGAAKLAKAHDDLAVATQKASTFLKIHPDAVNASSKSHGTYMQMLDKVTAAQSRVTAATGAATTITKALSDAVGGQASAAADTYAGKLEATKAQAENLIEKLGMHLLPVIGQVIDRTTTVVGWFEKHTTVAKALAVLIGGALTVAITAYVAQVVIAIATTVAQTVAIAAGTVVMGARILAVYAGTAAEVAANLATKAWAAGQWLLNAALTANPIGLVIVAVAALVAGVILAYKHSETFRTILNTLWSFIKSYVVAEFTVLKTVVLAVRDAIGWVVDKVEAVIGALGRIKVPQALKDAAGLIGKVGGAVGGAISHLPGFATGVTNFSGGLAVVGENGPEVVELPSGSNVYPHGSGPAGGSLTLAPHIEVHGHLDRVTLDDVRGELDEWGRELVRELQSGRVG